MWLCDSVLAYPEAKQKPGLGTKQEAEGTYLTLVLLLVPILLYNTIPEVR